MIRAAVVGLGYWGPNLLRNFAACPETRLAAACDQDPKRLQAVLRPYPGVAAVSRFEEVLARDDVDAVALATPVRTHGPLAKKALEAGKHVLVEKPLAASVAEAEDLLATAARNGRTLMVDHTFVYSAAVRRVKQLIDSGELGRLYFIDGVRINLGLFQHDVNVLWDLASHDFSILDYLLGRAPKSLVAVGACHADDQVEDVAHVALDYGDGLLASFHVNWLSPVKIRHLLFGGSRKSVLYNDLDAAESVKVYDRGITVLSDPESRRGVLINYRTGDAWIPHLEQQEPLQQLVRHFADCIHGRSRPLTGAEAGLRVVRVLEAAEKSVKAAGQRQFLPAQDGGGA